MKKKTPAEVIQETIDFYHSGNRSLKENGNCAYLVETTGTMCAVGRCLSEKGLSDFHNKEINNAANSVQDMMVIFPNSFKEEYKNISLRVWAILQTMHDDPSLWNNKGLNYEGEYYVKSNFSKYAHLIIFPSQKKQTN